MACCDDYVTMVITIDDITMVRAKVDITTEFFDSKIQSIDPKGLASLQGCVKVAKSCD